MSLDITFETDGDMQRFLERLRDDRWLDAPLRTVAKKLIPAQINHYRSVAESTPYSPNYIGKKKPSGRVVAGGTGDQGYGIDTGSLFDDLTSPIIQNREIIVGSDLDYADYQESLLQGNHGKSFFADEEEMFKIAEMAVLDALGRL